MTKNIWQFMCDSSIFPFYRDIVIAVFVSLPTLVAPMAPDPANVVAMELWRLDLEEY